MAWPDSIHSSMVCRSNRDELASKHIKVIVIVMIEVAVIHIFLYFPAICVIIITTVTAVACPMGIAIVGIIIVA